MADAPNDRVKVTMRSVVLAPDGTVIQHEAIDYVGTDILDAYVADAQTRWQSVTSEVVDELPTAVTDGNYTVPENLNVEAN